MFRFDTPVCRTRICPFSPYHYVEGTLNHDYGWAYFLPAPFNRSYDLTLVEGGVVCDAISYYREGEPEYKKEENTPEKWEFTYDGRSFRNGAPVLIEEDSFLLAKEEARYTLAEWLATTLSSLVGTEDS